MPTVEAIVQKMKSQPNGVRFEEIKRVLEAYGYVLARTKGSHVHFRNNTGNVITIKKDSCVKAVYVKDVLGRIEKQ